MRRFSNRQISVCAAFSLLEVVVSLALATLVMGVVVMGVENLAEERVRPPEDVLRTAVRKARMFAADTHQNVVLSFDKERSAFVLSGVKSGVLGVYELTKDEEDIGQYEVEFIPQMPQEQMARAEPEDTEYPPSGILFHSCGAGAPVRVKISLLSDTAETLLDPFYHGEPPYRSQDHSPEAEKWREKQRSI